MYMSKSHSRIAACGVWRTGRRRNRCGGEGCTSLRAWSSLYRTRRQSQQAEPLVVDERRCADLGTILDIMMSIDVGDRLPVPGMSKKCTRVCNDGFFGVRVSGTSSSR